MSPVLMTLTLLVALTAFAYQLDQKRRLILAKAAPMNLREGALGARLMNVLREGFGHRKLYQDPRAGLAHHVLFLGFLVLLWRTVVLWGRAFVPGFQGFGFAPDPDRIYSVGSLYQLLREYFTLGVLIAVGYFVAVRLAAVYRQGRARVTTSGEAWLILGLIAVMMVGDCLYDASGTLLAYRSLGLDGGCPQGLDLRACGDFVAPFRTESGLPVPFRTPGSTLFRLGLQGLESHWLLKIGKASYFAHTLLVLVFLNLLPRSKHFHVLVALPNLFWGKVFSDGKASTLAKSVEELFELVELASEPSGTSSAAIGKETIEHWDVKQRLELFACTECGRCTAHCPAALTHKSLNPKALTLSLREHLKAEAPRLLGARSGTALPVVPGVLEAKAIWACTTCRACEEQCPVGVTYLDTILGLRQNLMLMRAQAPSELHRAIDGMEANYNPWNFPKEERGNWALGLDVPLLKDVSEVEFLYWVGCAASYDERGKATARAFVRLMQRAKVTFAILGAEERCTGDSARRAGNELLYLQLAEANIALLQGYQASGRFRKILTTCPHCLNALGREYRDLGGQFDVLHHSVVLEQWLTSGKLRVEQPIDGTLTYHDPCTLARYAGITDAPRQVLAQLTRSTLREPGHHGRQTLCCGAGGAQMWMEEQNTDRMGTYRAAELVATGAEQVVSACPFCLSMLGDSVRALDSGALPQVSDLAPLLDQATSVRAKVPS